MIFTEFVVYSEQDAGAPRGAKIPWNEPGFSQRMLANHLDQKHDWASRRNAIVSRQTAWIAGQLQCTSRILDLGCGPGLYTQNLAALGHHCTGVDFSPASIAYARKQAEDSGLALEYALCDVRSYTSGQKFDCIIMTFGEFNVFIRQEAAAILRNKTPVWPCAARTAPSSGKASQTNNQRTGAASALASALALALASAPALPPCPLRCKPKHKLKGACWLQ